MKQEELILTSKKTKSLLLALFSLLFVFGGTTMISGGDKSGWFVSIFFALCFITSCIQLLPGASGLKINAQGFTITSLFKSHLTKWEDVKTFKEGFVGTRIGVLFDYSERHKKYKAGKILSKTISGQHAALPDTYGMKASDLAKLLNERRANYSLENTSSQ